MDAKAGPNLIQIDHKTPETDSLNTQVTINVDYNKNKFLAKPGFYV